MTEMTCRECGARVALRSRFEGHCTECGSEDLDEVDAYDPVEHELRCEYCGYSVDTAVRPSTEWEEHDGDVPTSVDDPCPICRQALVPLSEAKDIRKKPEYSLARAAAVKLHRDHDIAGPPYELGPLAAALGLDVAIGSFSHDGMLVGTTVEVPETQTSNAQRFTLAHEIAHFVMKHDGDRGKAEPEANALASELLVPREQLKLEISATPSVRALCRRFGVSRQAMVYALMAAQAIGRVQP